MENKKPKLKRPTKFVQPEMMNTSSEEEISKAIHKDKSESSPTKEEVKNLRNAVVMLMLNQRDMRQWLADLTSFVNASYPSENDEMRFGKHTLTIDDCYQEAIASKGHISIIKKDLVRLEEKLNQTAKTLEEALESEEKS